MDRRPNGKFQIPTSQCGQGPSQQESCQSFVMSARRPGYNHIKHGGQTSKKTTNLTGFYFRTLNDLKAEDRNDGHLYMAEDPF